MTRNLLSVAITGLVLANAAPVASSRGFVSVTAFAGDGHAELMLYGPIGEFFWFDGITAESVVAQLANINATSITVRINSDGGVVADGLAIYNALKRHPARITVVIDGQAASIASVIAMAGDDVVMPANSLLMVHAPLTSIDGNAVDLRQMADTLDVHAEALAQSYIAKTGKPDEIRALLADGRNHWFTAASAVEFGFADRVEEQTPAAIEASASAAALIGYVNAIAKAQGPVFASLRGHIQAAVTPPVFTSLPEATQRAVFAHIEDPSMKQQFQTIMANAAGGSAAPAAAAAPVPAAPVVAAAPAVVAAAAPAPGGEDVRAAFVASQRDRNTQILAAARPHAGNQQIEALRDQALADPDFTVDAFNGRAMAILGSLAAPAAGGPRVQAGQDQRDLTVDAGVNALMARASLQGADGNRIVVANGNPFGGMTLMDHARAAAVRAGVRIEGMDPRGIVAAAFTQSTSDFPLILENALHRTLLTAYQTAPDTWSRFCAIGSVGDFRAHNRYRVGSIGNLDSLNELGEFKNKTIPDGEKSSITAETKGNIINISRQAIINDDLGAFIGLAVALGRAGRRTIEAYVYALLAMNGGLGPVMADGLTLFHEDHGNLGAAGAAPTVDSIDAGRVAMASQMDVGGNDFLNLTPAIWLGPISLGGTARVVNGSEYDPDAPNKLQRANKVRGLVRDVVDTPRMTGNAWHLFADPNEASVIEVAFLNGDQNPYLESQEGFDVDGSRFKARLDFGVAALDYRGAYRNPGAA